MRSLLVLFGLLTTSVAQAFAAGTDEEPFPGYMAECGFSILFSPTLTVSQAVLAPNGRPMIILDPSLAAEEETAHRQFLIAHECAHHLMSHARPEARMKRAKSKRVVRDQEMSADCWAAETLARKGMDRTLRIMSDRFFKSGLYSPGGGYPAGIQRSTIILHCAETGRRDRAETLARIAAIASAVPATF